MKQWIAGYVLGLLLITNSQFTSQPLAFLNGLVGVFCWVIIVVNYYAKR